jgi:hypothetical protein
MNDLVIIIITIADANRLTDLDPSLNIIYLHITFITFKKTRHVHPT